MKLFPGSTSLFFFGATLLVLFGPVYSAAQEEALSSEAALRLHVSAEDQAAVLSISHIIEFTSLH